GCSMSRPWLRNLWAIRISLPRVRGRVGVGATNSLPRLRGRIRVGVLRVALSECAPSLHLSPEEHRYSRSAELGILAPQARRFAAHLVRSPMHVDHRRLR